MPLGGRFEVWNLILRVLDAFRPRGLPGRASWYPPHRVLVGGPPRRTSCLVAESPGFTELGAPSLPGFPISPLPGQCINSQPWLRALTHCVAPLMCGRPSAGAAGRVLLAGRQWDPLGLARRLPSLGAGAWRRGPLLPWRVQCPVCVCAALAAGSGGSGRYLVSCLSRFPLPAPSVPRRVWRAVPSGCLLPSLAGTPFHAVCAFRELGPVALLVVPECSLCVCALALPRRPLLPPVGGVVCAPRAVPALGAGRAVPLRVSCPGPLLSLACFGGGVPVPVPPYLAWPARPVGAACRVGGGGPSPGGAGLPLL